MEAIKDRLRVALALCVVEHTYAPEEIPAVIQHLRASITFRAWAARGLQQVLAEPQTLGTAEEDALASAHEEVQRLSAQMSESQREHALSLSRKDLEIQQLRLQIAAQPLAQPQKRPFVAGAQEEEVKEAIDPSTAKRPKTKKAKGRDAALQALDATLRQNPATVRPADDLGHGYGVLDALQMLRGEFKIVLKGATTTDHSLALFLDRVSLLERATVRLISAARRVLASCTELPVAGAAAASSSSSSSHASAKPHPQQPDTTLSANVAEILPVLVDVLQWALTAVSDLTDHAVKMALSCAAKAKSAEVQAAADALHAAVLSEVGALLRCCLDRVAAISARLQQTLHEALHNAKPKKKLGDLRPLRLQLDADARYRLVDLLSAMAAAAPSASASRRTAPCTLQEGVRSQLLTLLLKEVCTIAKGASPRPPSDREGDKHQVKQHLQAGQDVLALLLPLLSKVLSHAPSNVLLDSSVEEAYQTLLQWTSGDSQTSRVQAFKTAYGGHLTSQLMSVLEEMLLRYSVVDYTRLINLAPL